MKLNSLNLTLDDGRLLTLLEKSILAIEERANGSTVFIHGHYFEVRETRPEILSELGLWE